MSSFLYLYDVEKNEHHNSAHRVKYGKIAVNCYFFKENLQHFDSLCVKLDLIYLFLQRGKGSPLLLLQVLFPFFCFQKLLLQPTVLFLSLVHTSFDG